MPQEFSRLARLFSALAGFTLLAACGGGGGGANTGNPNPPPAPTVSLTANPTSITAGQTVTLTWSSTNATSCTAAGGWSGAKAISGTEVTAALSGATTFTLSCTGTGGSTSASASVALVSPPTLTLTAAQTALTTNYPTTLTWSSTDATACTASGGWTGTRPTSGTDSTGLVATASTYTLTCTGPGGSASQQVNITVTPPPAGQIVVSGRITFDRLPFNAVQGTGLSPTPVESPAREVVVEMTGGVTASTTSDAGGYYAFTVPESSSLTLRARAQLLRTGTAPTWNFRVLNNTNSDALYVLQGSPFNTGTTYTPRNLNAPSGFNGSTYSGTRAAAPFAILDAVYNAKQLILSADLAATLPPLNLYWSIDNRTASSPFCPDNGNIGTSFYFSDPSGTATDDCSAPLPEGIYILGDFAGGNGDTDEFDAHVIAHEFGHYFEDRFSRSDSIGGQHSLGDRLDLRVAFGEGWGNAYGAMSLGDPQYRDSSSGISDDFGFNLETDSANNQGWFSEASVGEILWDIFDNNSTPESGDAVALGFAPVYAVMTGPQINTDALTSIFTFATALRSANSSASGAIADLLSGESISGNNAFGANETNIGGDPTALPVYQDIALNSPLANVCSRSVAGSSDGNKLGNRRFLRFDNSQPRLVTITATGAASSAAAVTATDPDVFVYRRGALVAVGESAAPGQETLSQIQLGAGMHIIEVYDFDVIDSGTNQPARCMTVSISG
jgi:hypothetical protein